MQDHLFDNDNKAEAAPLASHRFYSESNEWYTPAVYIEAAREVMGEIELDPASCELANRVVRAERYYTIEDRALSHEWRAGTIWLNPPYCGEQAAFIARLLREYDAGRVNQAILLINANTSTNWFQWLWQYPICFTDHRIKFYNLNGEQSQPTSGNAFVYLGPLVDRFVQIFSKFGAVVKKI